MTPLQLSVPELALAALLILAAAALSWALRLGLQRTLLVSAARLVVQLVLVGLFLRQVFALSSPWLTALVVAVMLGAATFEVGSRQRRRLTGFWHLGIGGGAVGIATLGIALFALAGSLRPTPWYDARHAIPLVGIILGTAMNAASLALNQVFASVTRERAAIEARLALGADRHTALSGLIRRALYTGLIPTLNQMAAAGIITLPGIMTGQILAGMDPLDAARYQILLMFLLAGAGFIAALGAVYLSLWRLTDPRERLRLDRLRADD
ncbi:MULTISPECIES: ABC transporter permease [Pseudomonas]|uniref:Iron export ABC transporter permease subunit FetB n=2 Tax=Pseudomonas nitroreducens TaxID=46680 RepID=A0A6G6IP99_PSENT|nr:MULTISPECIES: iron export ABC transporter permease subunit FetB [Pseudomonas]MBG6289947.1 iron export ABC transporter permease subunit FetB [Pseudomonas nitroreducens]NNN23235.1 iron export ABC transporter permease subunit FetB [Pseudomonas nitroreducens]OBY56183.1 iron export ABC transporter permease subunit FetB [Pseudomonas sp. AU12215]QIE84879.1 iron export ABC transporter permease subunit FetB [Pseudomonas nitroreducens]